MLPVLVLLCLLRFRQLPDQVILFDNRRLALLLLMVYLAWYPFPQYAFLFMPFFLMSSIAASAAIESTLSMPLGIRGCYWLTLTAVVSLISVAVPFKNLNQILHKSPKCPDHRSAAQFLKTPDLDQSNIILAKDVLQRYCYGVKVE